VPSLPSEKEAKKRRGGWQTARSAFVSSFRLKVKVDQAAAAAEEAAPRKGFTTMKGRLWEKTKQRRETERFANKRLVPLSKKEYESLRSLFEKYDKSEDGVLSKEEFTLGISEMQPVLQPHALGMFQSTDKDATGWISFEEFLGMHCPWLHPLQMAKCIRKYGAPWGKSEQEHEEHAAQQAAKALDDITVSSEEREDIERVFETWARESGSPVKRSDLSFATVKQRCHDLLDPYTLREWFHQYGAGQGAGGAGKRIGRDAFVALVSGHYKTKDVATEEPGEGQEGDEKHMRQVSEQQQLVKALYGKKLTNSQNLAGTATVA